MSLMMRMMKEPFFKNKQILVIDQSTKTTNDRTWCFWEKETGLFESIVNHRWHKAAFFSDAFSSILELSPYQYKIIRGIDLYSFVKQEATKHNNIEWRNEKVISIDGVTGDKALVRLETGTVTAEWIFNSILFDNHPVSIPGTPGYYLLQHFKGWLIKTFMYVLPVSKTKALVEYTLFTESLLKGEQYTNALKEYIHHSLNLAEYHIEHEETGIIPMTNRLFPLQQGRQVNMGIAGGQAKGSSGYAFQFIQKRTIAIIEALISGNDNFNRRSLNDRKFHLFDSVLLNVLYNRKMGGDKIFASIFKKNPPERVLRFLDNESTLWEDLQIMQSVPTAVFLPAALQEMF